MSSSSADGLYVRKPLSFSTNLSPKNAGTTHLCWRAVLCPQTGAEDGFGGFSSNKSAPVNKKKNSYTNCLPKEYEDWRYFVLSGSEI
jgi:hypothetical protein